MANQAIVLLALMKTLPREEYDIWSECDSQAWICNVYENPGRHLIQHHGVAYTDYAVPFSADDRRAASHTEVFWEGIHTENEMTELIKNDSFLRQQFRM